MEYLPTNEEGLINGIFERINKNVAEGIRQELRHARFNGKFISTAEALAEWMPKQLPENFPRFEVQSRKQMKDVEFVSSLVLLIESGPSGLSQDDLDKALTIGMSNGIARPTSRKPFVKSLTESVESLSFLSTTLSSKHDCATRLTSTPYLVDC